MAETVGSVREVILNAVGDTADEMGVAHVALVTNAVLTALSAAGYVIVPREPTEAMMNAGVGWSVDCYEAWDAMLAAALHPAKDTEPHG